MAKNLLSSPHTISKETAQSLRASIIPPRAVVYAKIGAALLLNRRRLTTSPCCIDNNMTAYVTNAKKIIPDWAYYWLSDIDFSEHTNPGAVPSFSEGYQAVLPILQPSLPEQKAIAAFLDEKTAEIDALIAKKEELLLKLAEKRTAMITHAVTKGLNPSAPMKDSGIDWLGQIPAHWEVRRIKYIASCNDESLGETTDPDLLINYVDISSVDLINGIKKTEELTFEKSPSRARRIVKDGDTIISTVRTYLKAIAPIREPIENLIVSTGFAVIRPRKNLFPDFLGYCLQSEGFLGEVVAYSNGVSYPAINPTDLMGLPIPVPPYDQQKAIAAFLDKKTSEMDETAQTIRSAIDALKEYRSALITNAVTGKIDVRNKERQEKAA